MKRLSVLLTLIACLTANAGGCLAGGEGAAPRLDTRFHVDLVRAPLSDLCWVMEKRSGIPHEVADAATGELRASVVGSLSVGELQQALGDVLGVAWRRIDTQDATRFVAQRTPASIAEEQRSQQETDRAFREGLVRLIRSANRPDEELNKPPRDPGMDGILFFPANRAAVRALGYLSPAEQSRLLAGAAVEHPVATLPPQSQASVRTIADEANRRFTQSQAEAGIRLIDLQDGSNWVLRVSPYPMRWRPDVTSLRVAVCEPGAWHTLCDFMVNVSTPSPAPGDLTAGRLPRSAPPQDEPAWHAPLPDGYRPPNSLWEVVARDLSRRLGCPVVADAYLPMESLPDSGSSSARSGEHPEPYLNRICSGGFGVRRWGRSGRVITLQRADWPLMRRSQIPPSQVRRWQQHMLQTGRLALDDLLEMVALPPHQFASLGDVLMPQTQSVVNNREMLLLWKGLPAALRRRATEDQLVLRDLPTALQPEARSLVAAMLGTTEPLALANARLHVDHSQDAFTLTVTSLARPAVVRSLDLKVDPWWQARLKEEEQSRLATLEAAAGSLAEPRVQ